MKQFIYILIFIISFLVGWISTYGKKSQFIRILDILVFGPVLIYVAFVTKEKWLSWFLIFLGASTMGYNLKNYIKYSNTQS